jgi:hypothetical protein
VKLPIVQALHTCKLSRAYVLRYGINFTRGFRCLQSCTLRATSSTKASSHFERLHIPLSLYIKLITDCQAINRNDDPIILRTHMTTMITSVFSSDCCLIFGGNRMLLFIKSLLQLFAVGIFTLCTLVMILSRTCYN